MKSNKIYTKVDNLDSSKWQTSLKFLNLGKVNNWQKLKKNSLIAQISGKLEKISTNLSNFLNEDFPDESKVRYALS